MFVAVAKPNKRRKIDGANSGNGATQRNTNKQQKRRSIIINTQTHKPNKKVLYDPKCDKNLRVKRVGFRRQFIKSPSTSHTRSLADSGKQTLLLKSGFGELLRASCLESSSNHRSSDIVTERVFISFPSTSFDAVHSVNESEER